MPPRFFYSTIGGVPGPNYLLLGLSYERKPVTDLWNKLTAYAKQRWLWKNVHDKTTAQWRRVVHTALHVYGPPGSGKSTATFAWVAKACRDTGTTALWIHAPDSDQGEAECWELSYDEAAQRTRIEQSAVVPTKVDSVGTDVGVVVVDGVRASSIDKWTGLYRKLAIAGIASVMVSSEGVRINVGGYNNLSTIEHFVSSWTIPEYVDAVSSDQLWRHVFKLFQGATATDIHNVREQHVRQKFGVAGHSARFMFARQSGDTKVLLASSAEATNAPSIESGLRSARSAGAVNSLIARFEDGANGATPTCTAMVLAHADIANIAQNEDDLWWQNDGRPKIGTTFVSPQGAAEVHASAPLDIAKLKFIAEALNNNAIKGYALGLQCQKSLLEAQHGHISFQREPGAGVVPITFPVTTYLQTDDIEQTLRTHFANANTWIWVGKMQPAFDAVHVVSATHVRFLQLTAGETHDFFIDVIDSLIRKLGQESGFTAWSYIELVIVRPSDDRRLFRLGKIRGSLGQGQLTFGGENWLDNPGDKIEYMRLEWNVD